MRKQKQLASKSQHPPTDAELAKTLGKAHRHWEDFITGIQRKHPGTLTAWKSYAIGWRFIVRDKRRNLVYLRPTQGRFTASFAFRDDAVEAAELADLPDEIISSMRNSPVYPEGRAVRLEIASGADVGIARKLLAIKIAH